MQNQFLQKINFHDHKIKHTLVFWPHFDFVVKTKTKQGRIKSIYINIKVKITLSKRVFGKQDFLRLGIISP